MSYDHARVERIASQMRRVTNTEGQDAVAISTVFQKFIKISGWRYEIAPCEPCNKNEEAWADPTMQTVVIREDVWNGAIRQDPRSVFTLAEEMAHIACGHQKTRHRKAEYGIAERAHNAIWGDEKEAKQVAAAFLMPVGRIKDNLTAEEAAQKFGVSTQVAQIRLHDLGKENIIRRPKRVLPSAVIDFLREAKARGINIQTSVD